MGYTPVHGHCVVYAVVTKKEKEGSPEESISTMYTFIGYVCSWVGTELFEMRLGMPPWVGLRVDMMVHAACGYCNKLDFTCMEATMQAQNLNINFFAICMTRL